MANIKVIKRITVDVRYLHFTFDTIEEAQQFAEVAAKTIDKDDDEVTMSAIFEYKKEDEDEPEE